MKRLRKKLAVIGTMTVVLLLAGVAWAAWTVSGSGSGYAKAKTVQPLTTVNVSASTAATLYPGATGDVKLSIDNSGNSFGVTVTSVTGSGVITSSGGAGLCLVSGVTYTDQTGLSLSVPASSSATFTLSNAVSMGNNSDNGCQGATFTIPVSLAGTVS